MSNDKCSLMMLEDKNIKLSDFSDTKNIYSFY